jgi:hypothetical protein
MHMVMRYDTPLLIESVMGDATGLSIPAHADGLRTAGASFLTDAFRKFGSLSPDNSVARITRFESYAGGNSGHKVLLSVEYERPQRGLHTDLFVKFSRDFKDAFRDRRRHELEAECRFAALSRRPHFPIHVPAAYFADFHNWSGTGLLITQQIPFGREVEPLLPKCRDHELTDPLQYYRAIISTLASLVAAHKSGALSPEVETCFPFDAELAAAEDPIPYTEQQLCEAVSRFAAFAASYPQLVPVHLRDPKFIAQLERDVVRFRRNESAVKRFLQSDRAFIALCHYNANLDNAWFWRDARGGLHSGLLDWGRVRQMNVAYALWGSLCCATLDLWDNHLDELLSQFVTEVHAGGGPLLAIEDLRLNLHSYVTMMCLATMIEAPTLVLSRLPEAAHASGPLDPIFRKDEVARSFLHVFTVFLNLWQRHGLGASLDRVLSRSRQVALPEGGQEAVTSGR